MRHERLRELERAVAADPENLVALRELADERKRRGLELLPDVVRVFDVSRFWPRAFLIEQWLGIHGLGQVLADFEREDWSLSAEAMRREQARAGRTRGRPIYNEVLRDLTALDELLAAWPRF